MKVWERIESLRNRMREEDIDVYYIPPMIFMVLNMSADIFRQENIFLVLPDLQVL